jgi:hypothetical protein
MPAPPRASLHVFPACAVAADCQADARKASDWRISGQFSTGAYTPKDLGAADQAKAELERLFGRK